MKHLDYVFNLTKFAFRFNPLLYVSVIISVISVFVELLAMSSLLPLFEMVSGGKPSTNGIIAKGLHVIGFEINSGALFGAFIALLCVRIVTQLLAQSLSQYLGRRVMAQLATRAFEQIMRTISVGEINKKSIGYYISLAGDESFRASTLVISLTQFIGTASLGLLYYAAIARYSLVTAGVVFVFLLSSLIALTGVFKASHRLGGRQIEESRRASSVFLDSLNNLKAVRAFSAEGYVAGLYRSLMFGYTRTLFLIDEMALLSRLVPILLLLLIASLWMIWGGLSIEGIGLAFVVTMTVYLMRFFPVVGQGLNLLMKMISDAKVGRDVTTIIGVNWTDLPENSQSISSIEEIEFKNVCFSYGGSTEKSILKQFNFKFEKGKSYALSGKSGVGKSTLIDLLLKFYPPSSGSVCINGVSIGDLSDSEIRKRIVLVSQEAAIFDDTVMNNICMGMETNLAVVQAACATANIHDVIEAMDERYNTRLQYQGKNLSGGQRQRIAIARAVLRNPDVLILDESTSALDKHTQSLVIENILRIYSDKIVIFVTHDPHIMELADEVIDLANIHTEK